MRDRIILGFIFLIPATGGVISFVRWYQVHGLDGVLATLGAVAVAMVHLMLEAVGEMAVVAALLVLCVVGLLLFKIVRRLVRRPEA